MRFVPDRKTRSRLEPYRELIVEHWARRRSLREIAAILERDCNLRVGVSTLHNLVKVPISSRRLAHEVRVAPGTIRERIGSLNTKETPVQSSPNEFDF